MKKQIHPQYRPVVFRDRSAGTSFLTRSTLVPPAGAEHVEWPDGNSYPVVDVQVSSASHPFWTGRTRTLDTLGRVERFHRRYGAGR